MKTNDPDFEYLPLSELEVRDHRLYVNAGGADNLFVSSDDGATFVLAGNEGGMLRSLDNGYSFQYVFKYEDNGSYPYPSTILFPRGRPDLPLTGGFDKGLDQKPFLAYGAFFGTKWTNVSWLLDSIQKGIVTQLTGDESGAVVMVAVDVERKKVMIYRVKL